MNLRFMDHDRLRNSQKRLLLLAAIIFCLISSFRCAFGQTSRTLYYDVQIGPFSGKSTSRALLKKFREIGIPLYSLPTQEGNRLVADINTSRQDAEIFIDQHLSGTQALPVVSKRDVAPNAAVVATGIYPFSQVYHYVPNPSQTSGPKEQEAKKEQPEKRMTTRELASMPPKPGQLSATELAALPPKPPKLSARDLVRLSRDGNDPGTNPTEPDDIDSDQIQPDYRSASYANVDQTEFIAVISDYISRETHGFSLNARQPETARKMAAYYAAWIFDAARLYKLDPFLMVAIPDHETNFMNVDGDLNHFTNGVRNHSEGIFQMLKTTQVEVYQDMRQRGLTGLISWRPGLDLKKFPRDQVYMAAHFLRFFCEAYPRNYRNALTTYNGSPSYPNKVFNKLKKVTKFYTRQTS